MKTPVILQSSKGESGAICLAMVLGHYESFPKLNLVKEACDTGSGELSPENFPAVAQRFGFKTRTSKNTSTASEPFIVEKQNGGYALVVGRSAGHYVIHDPEKGKEKISESTFREIFGEWILSLEPSAEFEKIEKTTSFEKEIKTRLLPYTKSIGYVLLAGVILLIPGIIIPSLNKLFFDDIIILAQSNWFKPMISMMIAFLMLGSILVYLQQWILLRTELKLSLIESAKFVLHVLKVPYTYFQSHPTGDTVKRIGLNDTIAILLARDFTTLVLNLLTVLFYGFVMIKYNWILTLVGISVMLINIFALRFFSAKRTALNQALFQKQQATFSVATSGIEQIETLKASGAENDFFSLWSSHLITAINDDQKLGKTSRLLTVLPDFLSQLNNVIILLLGGLLIIYGEISVGVFIALQSFIANFSDPVKSLVDISGNVQLNRGNLNNLLDTLDEPIDPFCNTETRVSIDTVTPFNARLTGKLEVKNLTFGYSKFSAPLIEDFSLTAYPGKHIAFVGGSGSGKSTLLKVISGLYAPRSGEILYDDISINNLNDDVLRNSLSMVDQDSFFFTGTISDNIVMWNRAIDNDAVIQAAKDAEIHEIISQREGGYQAKVAPDGRNFSGGQRQRLEIARAMVSNPSILFLDEATSALDTETERKVMDNFKKKNCTTITIAHRLSTIRDADEIIVLERGKVIERGTHDELMKIKDGFYYKLVKES